MPKPIKANETALVLIALVIAVPGCVILVLYHYLPDLFTEAKGTDKIFAAFMMVYPIAIVVGFVSSVLAEYLFARPRIFYRLFGSILVGVVLSGMILLIALTLIEAMKP